ncbi:MAG: 3-oxoacyl-[acyl-carrier-protein] reductase [Candidatus Natronoplasma sp.]
MKSDEDQQLKLKSYFENDDIENLDPSSNRLEGLNALVTGGGQGIGRRISLEFANEGANVAINDLSSQKDKADRVAQYIEGELNKNTWIAEGDVSDLDDMKKVKEQVEENLGKIDILVNNAGINRDSLFIKMDKEEWDQVLSVNLDGAFNTTHVFLDHLRESDQGRIINMSSVVGETGNIGQVNYASSKAGLIGFTKALARELVRDEVTVNAVAPGFVDTLMVKNMPEKVKKKILDQIPMGRFAEPKEVAKVFCFLASEKSSYITGEVIRMNGGFYL